jgi:tRNA threonylcarbamoyladenosine biosynthesis protein TsaE
MDALSYTTLTSSSPEETIRLGYVLGERVQSGDIVLLTGDLGAGKTQFAKGFAAGLGITQTLTSPTFPLVLTYDEGRLPLNHFDLYRLNTADQLHDIDYDYMVQHAGVSLVEWGDKFEEPYKEADMEICLTRTDDTTRELELRAFTLRGVALSKVATDRGESDMALRAVSVSPLSEQSDD